MDTPRNNLLPGSWESLSPIKLTITILDNLALDKFPKSKAAHTKKGGLPYLLTQGLELEKFSYRKITLCFLGH